MPEPAVNDVPPVTNSSRVFSAIAWTLGLGFVATLAILGSTSSGDKYLEQHKQEMDASHEEAMQDVYDIAGGKEAFETGMDRREHERQERSSLESKPTAWRYDAVPDEMSKGTGYYARIESSNVFEFSFPYNGPQKATLTVRSHPRWGKDVYLNIERGQLQVRSYDETNIQVRFDDHDSRNFEALGAEDNDSSIAFIKPYSRFVDSLGKSKRVRISISVYQEGSPVFDFNVEGFDASKLKAGKK